jgi:hypothetical protein
VNFVRSPPAREGTAMEPVNSKTGMTHSEVREFIRDHFEEFVNKKNYKLEI